MGSTLRGQVPGRTSKFVSSDYNLSSKRPSIAPHLTVFVSFISNQFATKSYYNTLFAEYLKDSNPKHPMEWRMGHLVAKNCSLAPFLYGAVREGPYLTHLDGRQSKLEDLVEYN